MSYRENQIQRIIEAEKESTEFTKIKLSNNGESTKYLNITPAELMRIQKLLKD